MGLYTHGNDIDTEVDIHTGGAYTLWTVPKVEHTHVDYTHGWSVHIKMACLHMTCHYASCFFVGDENVVYCNSICTE